MIHVIIPARGGSKGIPDKNVTVLCGKPLIVWTIEHALSAQRVDCVTVATDSHTIASVAKRSGAVVFKRSARSASDTAPTEAVLREWMQSLDVTPSLVVLLQCTSPIRQPDDIDNAIRLLETTGADSVFSARRVEGFTWVQRNLLVPSYGQRKRRQDVDHYTLEENGSIYVFRPDVLSKYHARLGGHVEAYQMHPLDSFQIDEPDDLDLLRQLMPLRTADAVIASCL